MRQMYVSEEIHGLLVGPWAEPEWEERFNYLRADLDRFIEGSLIPIAREPYKGKTSYMLRLQPPADEVWEIRSRDPEPSIRVFGRFAEKDIFIALTWALRADLKHPGSREWRDASVGCKTDWIKLFHPYLPKSGADIHGHISNFFFV